MCETCGKEPNEKTDARELSKRHDVALRYLRHCPTCFQALTAEEEDAVTRKGIVARCTVPEN